MRHVFIRLGNTSFQVAVITATQGFRVGHPLFGDSGVQGVCMTKLAVWLCAFYRIRILRSDPMGTFVICIYDFFVGEFFLCKRRRYMALIRTIDFLNYRIMRNFGNISMTVTAFDFSVNAVAIDYLIDIVIPALAISIDSAAVSVFVAHETVVFIRSVGLGRREQKKPNYRRKQQYDDTSFIYLQNAVAHGF
jgi:hypothetical protein